MINGNRGVSLIEVLVGLVIVTVATIGALSFFSRGVGGIGKEGNRRAALEQARARLEQLMAAPITQVEPSINGTLTPDNQPKYWISCANGSCTRTASYASETVSVDDLPNQRIESTVQWKDDSTADTTDPDTLELTARVWFTSNLVDDDSNRVYLKTLRSP
ncbi:MAG: type II secretion system protein [Candidatus Aenigmarchaeota archaeon]|nr:type II secretion system protein [Candidatus Aenigmarchaeota archaeon]